MASEHFVKSLLLKYRYQDSAKRDIMYALRHYPDLTPSLENYVFNDGTTKELVRLKGTIPVLYKGNTYNIPVALWLLDTHPQNAPLCFVTPTSSMAIRPSKHVDANGRIYLPYLHDWKSPGSDLHGLVQVMCVVFGEESPVFSRMSPVVVPLGRPPYPTHTSGFMPMPDPAVAARPPYPVAGGSQPYPPYPVASPPSVGGSGSTPSPAAAAGQYSAGPAAAAGAAAGGATSAAGQQQLSDEQIKASLLSAVEDKMRRRLREIFAQATAEMSALRRTQEELSSGKQRLEQLVSGLEAEQTEMEAQTRVVREKTEEMRKVVAEMSERASEEEMDIDEAVVTTAPLYRQLLNLFAEENATEDAIYFLGEGLRKGVITLDVFLKHVRELSRKQFILRATMEKCRIKAGLPV